MTEFITMLILAAAASAAFLYWLRLRQRQHELWLPTRPMKHPSLRPARTSESGEAARLRRHMALRVQLARLARESARKKPPGQPDFAETTIQDEPRPS